MKAFVLIIIAVISYTMGSMNGAIIVSRLEFHRDVRNYGSGNAGLTNFHRTFGVGGMLTVVAIDLGKAIISCLLGGWLMGLFGYPMVGKVFAGFCVMLGHSYPVFFAFRGGKGALTGFGMLLMADWRVAGICFIVFITVIAFTRYVSFGSIVGSACAPLAIWAFGYGGLEGTLTLLCWLLLVFQHRSNIGRLITGTESRLRIGKTVEEKLKEDF
ncbi:MAG: glycerol-3-phosphate acyltransferase [Candidatus Heteroscillospira sp.]|jgi:glycerol-3-phosphate acyltransferase PlsY